MKVFLTVFIRFDSLRRRFSGWSFAHSAPAVLLLVLLSASPLYAAKEPVTVREDKITLPTYLLGSPDPNPQFYFGGNSQGAQQRIYPYPLYDNLTTEKVDKTYTIVYLENEYVRIGVLPEIGGKVFEAVDKTNGYNFVYRQHVIKPALISLLGAWISGGIEWDIPHHHRASTFLPVQYEVEEAADGSKTVWVGELELRDRMRWAVGLTLHPGKSYLEASFRMVNRTPLPTSMLSFSNVAVSVNDTYQIIFPPRTQFVTYHTKNSFTTWPIATTKFAGGDYTAGVDASWYKNHFRATSMFAWNYEEDFFAGYDHGKNAGIMSVTDHNFAPGKKFFTWGNNPEGHAQDTLLTDSDGPYIELMVGAYSDNQPDYTWLAPNETRSWTQYWYPFRGIDGVKNANRDAAVNLEVKDGNIHLGFYTTAAQPHAKITLRLKDRVLLDETAAIDPAKPWTRDIPLPAGADEHDLRAALAVNGTELVAYSPVRLEKKPLPATVDAPYPPPASIATTEELYLTGLRAEQFHAPKADPKAYWEEALRRDPGDVRVNTVMGIACVRAGRFADAERYLRKALERATHNYTTPKDEEAFYYLGLALKAQGKTDEAFNQFAKSTWSDAWRSPGYLEMARIETLRGNNGEALGDIDSSLDANTKNVQALALRAALLRRAGRMDEARAAIAQLRAVDPLDVRALAEQWLADRGATSAKALTGVLTAFPDNALEVAVGCMNAGLWQDGSDILKLYADAAPEPSKVSPLVYYDLAYFAEKLHQPDQEHRYEQLAVAAPTSYVFPFQMEMIAVLEHAMTANPADARAPFYMGNLLYDWQPERAEALWEKSAALGADFPVVYHNLAMVYERRNEHDKQIAALEKAVQFGGNAMVLFELDKIYEQQGVAPEKRLALMESHQSVLDRDEVIAREVNLEILAGKPDAALRLLQSRFFRAWEGGGRFSLGDAWVNAHLIRGRQRMASGEYKQAIEDFQAAMQTPANLREALGNVNLGTPVDIAAGHRAELNEAIGNAYKALGDRAKAEQFWREAAEGSTSGATGVAAANAAPGQFGGHIALGGLAPGANVAHAGTYYQALALEQLGESGKAKQIYQHLIEEGTQSLGNASTDKPKLADAHYLVGLGELGLKQESKARQEFTTALENCPEHFAAHTALAALSSRESR